MVAELLQRRYGNAEWIFQVAEAVKNAVHNGVTQLGQGAVVQSNARPGDQYQFPARTREELIRDAALAADSRAVGANEQPRDPIVTKEKPRERPQQGHDDGPVQWML